MATAASLLTAGPAGAADPVVLPAPTELRVISWNSCGEAGGTRGDVNAPGYCPHRDQPDLRMQAIAALAVKQQASVVMLQEVCGYSPQTPPAEQAKTHQRFLEAALPGWTVVHAIGDRGPRPKATLQDPPPPPPQPPTNCRGTYLGGDIGVLIAVKGSVTPGSVQSFESAPATLTAEDFTSLAVTKRPTDEKIYELAARRKPVLCVRKDGWPDRICTTHLFAGREGTPDSVVRGMQAQEIRTRLGADIGAGLIIGGDFNAKESNNSLEPIAGSLMRYANGEFTHKGWEKPAEAGDPGTPLTHRYDHIFTSKRNRITSVEVDRSLMDQTDPYKDPEPAKVYSDHAPVIATVSRASQVPGDLNGDTLPDLLRVEGSQMLLYPGDGRGGLGAPTVIGTQGWADASVTHRGDWTGDGAEDIVARVKGEVRLFPNQGGGRISGHTVLATGLPTDAKIVGVGDATGDGFPDLVAQYEDMLYRYDGVPGATAALKPPVTVGTSGWDEMTMTAPGDADGDGRVDLLARRASDGLLWLYHGRDGGSFGTRMQFGHAYTVTGRPLIAGGADANGDGTADMWATTNDGKLLFYPGGYDAQGAPVDLEPDTSWVVVASSGWSTAGSSIS